MQKIRIGFLMKRDADFGFQAACIVFRLHHMNEKQPEANTSRFRLKPLQNP